MKLKVCNRIGLVLVGVWIFGVGVVLAGAWILEFIVFGPIRLYELEFWLRENWINLPFAILVVGSVAAYLLPFLVRWILKGLAD